MKSDDAFNDRFLVRGAFVVLLAKILFFQTILGAVYFIFLGVLNLENVGFDPQRFIIFGSFQVVQTIVFITLVMRWFFRAYEINEKEVVVYKGIVSRRSAFYSLEKLETVRVSQGILGTIFGYGTISITMHYNDQRDTVVIHNISHPNHHARVIEKTLKSFV